MTIEAKLILLAQAVGADVKALKLADGDLTSLSTTAKDNLVAALNEVYDLVGEGGEDPTKLPLAGGRMTGAIEYAGYGTITAANAMNIEGVNANTVRVDNPGGPVTINSIGGGTSGTRRILFFNASNITLVHTGGLTLLPGNANITPAAGDHAEFACEGGATWRCMWYTRRDGTSLVGAPDATKLPLAGGRMTGPIEDADYVALNAADNLNIAAANSNTVRIDSASAVTIGNFASGVAGTRRILFFNTALVTLTHNSGLTILPGNANIVAGTGDHAEFRCEGGATWRCMWYQRRDGTALVAGAAGVAIDDNAGTGDTDVTWSADKSVTFITDAVATLEASLMGGAGAAYDTFKELQDLIIADQSGLAALAADIANRVRFDAAQTLNGTQKTQARDNIGAVSQADVDATIVATVGDVAHDFVADYEAAKA